jgi:hypothetical protein
MAAFKLFDGEDLDAGAALSGAPDDFFSQGKTKTRMFGITGNNQIIHWHSPVHILPYLRFIVLYSL